MTETTDYDVTVHVPMYRPMYELLQLEADRMGCDRLEDCIHGIVYNYLMEVQQNEFRERVEPPVGVSDEVGDRMWLLAEYRRQAGDRFPWADIVHESVTIKPEIVAEDTDEDITPEWADWP